MASIRFLICCTSLAVGAAWCVADEPDSPRGGERRGGDRAQLLRRFDVNGDGILARTEIPPHAAERFDKMDLDGDGNLTRDEIGATNDRSGGRAPRRPGEVIAPAAVQERYKDTLEVGDLAPDFKLRDADGMQEVSLSELRAHRPVVLVFGSYTCSPFRQRVLEVERLYREYGSRANFLFVYIREAHPDSILYALKYGEEVLEAIGQTHTLEERGGRAEQCVHSLHLSFPVVADHADNRVNRAYAAWPIRLAVVDTHGRVAYLSGPGPWGFKPVEVEDWLRKNGVPAAAESPVEAQR